VALLDKVCGGSLISADALRRAGALTVPAKTKAKVHKDRGPELFGREHY